MPTVLQLSLRWCHEPHCTRRRSGCRRGTCAPGTGTRGSLGSLRGTLVALDVADVVVLDWVVGVLLYFAVDVVLHVFGFIFLVVVLAVVLTLDELPGSAVEGEEPCSAIAAVPPVAVLVRAAVHHRVGADLREVCAQIVALLCHAQIPGGTCGPVAERAPYSALGAGWHGGKAARVRWPSSK